MRGAGRVVERDRLRAPPTLRPRVAIHEGVPVNLARGDVLVDAAEEPALVDRGARAEREPVDVIELHLIRGAADSAALERPRAAPAIARPDPAPDLGGDVAASLLRRGQCPGRCRSRLPSHVARLLHEPAALRVTLEEPNGDLGYLMAMPFLAPIPPDPTHPDARYGALEGHDRDGSGYLVSSGPYMLEGSEQMDPAADVPASGYSSHGVTLVRNPSWDRASDPLRPAYADRIELIPVPEGAGGAWLRSGRVDLLFDRFASPGEAQRSCTPI